MATKYGYASNNWMAVTVEYHEKSAPTFFLPHQCEEWEIGDADDLRAMIKDLKKALKKAEDVDGSV